MRTSPAELGTLNPKPEGSVHATWKSVARPALGMSCGSGFGVQDWNLGSEGSRDEVRERRTSGKIPKWSLQQEPIFIPHLDPLDLRVWAWGFGLGAEVGSCIALM